MPEQTLAKLSKAALERNREYNRRYYEDNKDALYAKWLMRRYGMTVEAFSEMLAAQDGACAICKLPFDLEAKAKKPHIDHDHVCCAGRNSCGSCVRGLLCYRCNQGLGSFRDDISALASAIAYLDQGT